MHIISQITVIRQQRSAPRPQCIWRMCVYIVCPHIYSMCWKVNMPAHMTTHISHLLALVLSICVGIHYVHWVVNMSLFWILQDRRKKYSMPNYKIERHKALCSSSPVSVHAWTLQACTGTATNPISACLTHVGGGQLLPVSLHPCLGTWDRLCLAAQLYLFLAQVQMPTEPCLSAPCLTHSQTMIMWHRDCSPEWLTFHLCGPRVWSLWVCGVCSDKRLFTQISLLVSGHNCVSTS